MNTLQAEPKTANGQAPPAIPAQHYALQMSAFGIDGLRLGKRATPEAASNQILVRVWAAALNYLDLLVVEGLFNNQLPLPHILGTDVAGEVVAVGNEVTRWKVGDTILPTFIRNWRRGAPAEQASLDFAERPSLGRPGLFAEYVVLDETEVTAAPVGWTYSESATLVIAGVTVWNALKYANLQPGETILLYGTGGVSLFALQLGLLRGARVVIVGGDDQKLEIMRERGASATWNYQTQPDWPQQVRSWTGGKGVEVVFESVGGDNLNKSLEVLANGGRIPMVGLVSGFASNMNVGLLLNRQARVIGMEVGSTQDLADLVQALNIHQIRPVIDRTYPVAQAQEAFRYLKAGQHFGKVLLTF